jgi:hypothetical protein
MSEVNVVPPDLQSKIAMWRRKSNDGTITLEEMKEAIIALRSGRKAAAEASAASGKKTKQPTRSADDMLSELGGL